MNPTRARLLGGALLLAAAVLPACAADPTSPTPPPTGMTTPSTQSTTSASVPPEAGQVRFEIVGPPGSSARIDYGVGTLVVQTTQPLPWDKTEVAPMTPFAVTIQAAMPEQFSGMVSCRITVEGREVASAAEPRGVLCSAMNVSRSPVLWTARS